MKLELVSTAAANGVLVASAHDASLNKGPRPVSSSNSTSNCSAPCSKRALSDAVTQASGSPGVRETATAAGSSVAVGAVGADSFSSEHPSTSPAVHRSHGPSV